MAILKYHNVGIKAIAACVPKNISRNADLAQSLSQEEVDKIINNIGIKEKRFVDEGTTPADLCFAAAQKLFEDNNIDKSTIDVLIFMSQLPDFKIPATSPTLQHRLGLPKTTACFDMSLACSGYLYALSTAFAYASMPTINRVLLLDGETFTRIVNPKDKVNAPLYGDAGTATLIEKGNFSDAHFVLYTDGAGADAIKIEAGGARCPSNSQNILVQEREEGNLRSGHQIYMDGLEVFNFTLKVVPNLVKEILNIAEKNLDNIDHYVFHQANKFMLEFFVKKLKIPIEKVPFSLDRFGNTSSATIPLTIVSELANSLENSDKNIILAGFGAGLSWAGASLTFKDCKVSPLIEI